MANQTIGLVVDAVGTTGVLHQVSGVIAQHQGDITSVDILANRPEEARTYYEVILPGEVAALVMLEAVVRLLPGVIGNAESLVEESHSDGLLEGPAYTKPPTWRDLDVPPVLLSGHHGDIARWRRAQALARTALRRPDLLAALDDDDLTKNDRAAIANAISTGRQGMAD